MMVTREREVTGRIEIHGTLEQLKALNMAILLEGQPSKYPAALDRRHYHKVSADNDTHMVCYKVVGELLGDIAQEINAWMHAVRLAKKMNLHVVWDVNIRDTID